MVELVLVVIGVVAVALFARRFFKKEDATPTEPTGGDVYVPSDFKPDVQVEEKVAPPVAPKAKKAVAKKTAPKKRGRPAKKTTK